ncbi:pentapeptide repeat-containing protein [uncultured Sulfitobacter sp.]|uniref:pentapeptide repeat-containing protein n=1 Tax=uncultured Sulfitobacter sp. TaxID=191468 RepID=UPI00261D5088|nr:pentapeptide repeat-containing protein [uncultured Sulfitobacter sp.]
MSRIVEDYLTEREHQLISDVFDCNSDRFDILVRIAGLDPSNDLRFSDLRNLNFCGADLRGFDFSGSDLRGCVIDEATLIDETTLLEGTTLQWISERDIPIVQLMQEVQSAGNSPDRCRALETINIKFGKTDHVISFVVNAAADVKATQAFLDYAEFLPSNLPSHHLIKIVDIGVRVLRRKFAKAKARTGREATTIFAASTITERLAKADRSFAADWFSSLAEMMDTDIVNNRLAGTTAKLSKEDLIRALERMKPAQKAD